MHCDEFTESGKACASYELLWTSAYFFYGSLQD